MHKPCDPVRRRLLLGAAALIAGPALSTAPDFRSFHQRTLACDFDIVITGAPLGWHAHLEAKHHILAVNERMVRLYILVAKDSPINSVGDLRGKTLATIDPP